MPLGKWLMAIHLICGAKKGISALQLMRHLGLKNNYKTAWFMAHRIRYAMTQEPLFGKLKGTVEADETFIGGKSKNMHAKVRKEKITGSGDKHSKAQVLTLVERGGKVKTRHMQHVTSVNLRKILREHMDVKSSFLMSNENRVYKEVGPRFAGHQAVNHSKEECVRGVVHVNTAESFHALLKRGVMGTYHHWSKNIYTAI